MTISTQFGITFNNVENRIKSYDFIESFISNNHPDFSKVPNTEALVKKFLDILKRLENLEFAFLLVHSGFIPEQYPADSSPETLYSKLVETLVLEFAIRMGYSRSYLPTQKSSMEDVTFIDGNNTVIVCDSKSFRLGRSQGAPNVKDVLKHADIQKWMDNHSDKSSIGGLVTIPSQHDWAKGSDFYSYTSDKDLPTMCLYYEHLAFLLINQYSSEQLNQLLINYNEVFPNKLKDKKNNRSGYYLALEANLFKGNEGKWLAFNRIAQIIIQEKVFHCVNVLEKNIENTRQEITAALEKVDDIEVLRKIAIDAQFKHATEDLKKQEANIYIFRDVSTRYYD